MGVRFFGRIGLTHSKAADAEELTPSGSGGPLEPRPSEDGASSQQSLVLTRQQSTASQRDGSGEGPDGVSSQHTLDIRSVATVMNGHATAVGTRTQDASGLLEPLRNHHRYEMISDLNRGASGFVQLALDHHTGKEVAIKFRRHGPGFESRIVARELINQRMCYAHPHIVQLQEVFKTQYYLGIAMEFCDGGDLSQYIDNRTHHRVFGLPESQARWLFQQLMVAVDYCHRLGIVNRDIKLDNIMLHGAWPRPILKICDFGYSKDEVGQSVSKSTCGTPEYMAPEVLFEEKYDGKGADVWSCGVSLYVMLAGMFPFARAQDDDETNVMRMQRMFTRIIKADYEPLPHVSPAGQHLLHLMLCPNPRERITVAEVMRHPWFQTELPPPLLTINGHLTQAVGISGGIGANVQSAAQILQLLADCSQDHSFRTTSAQMPVASAFSTVSGSSAESEHGFTRKPSPLGQPPPVHAAPRAPRNKAQTLNFLTRSSL